MANKPIFEILDAEFWILYIYMLRKVTYTLKIWNYIKH